MMCDRIDIYYKRGVYLEQEKTALAQLENALRNEGKLKIPCADEKIPLWCLRAKKNNVEQALNLVYKYFRQKSELSGSEGKLRPSIYKHVYPHKIFTLAAPRDSFGRVIALIRVWDWDPCEISFEEIFTSGFLLADEAIASEETQFNGVTVIFDLNGFCFNQLKHMTPARFRMLVTACQDSFPMKLKQIHVINHPSIFYLAFSVIKPFLKEKIRNRVILHKSLDSMHEYLEPSILPDFLGGHLTYDEFNDGSILQRILHKEKNMSKFQSASLNQG